MADTKHPSATAPVEGDGVNYSGIVWFVVILTATTLFCQILVWGAFEVMEKIHVTDAGIARAPLSAPAATPSIGVNENAGRLMTGLAAPPTPGMVVDEPSVLAEFRRQEQATLSTYAWVDKGSGVVRIPIDRAKALLIERGLPVRNAATGALPASSAKPAATVPTAPETAGSGR